MEVADVDSMSANELRSKLAEFGFPVMPITASTRALMVKKLRHLMAARNSAAKPSIAKYSSGEDSDLDVAPKRKARASMPPPQQLQRSKRVRASLAPRVETDNGPAPFSPPSEPEERPSRVRTSTARTVPVTVADGFETGSDSEVDSAPAPVIRRHVVETSSVAPPSDDLSAIRARLGLTRPSDLSSSRSAPDDYDSPYLSDFTRRLSALKADGRRRFEPGEPVNGGDSHSPRSPRAPPASRRLPSGRESYPVSLAIVSLGVVFFVAVAVTYLGMKSEPPFDPLDQAHAVPVCSPNGPDHRPAINCVQKQRLAGAADLLKAVRPELLSRATEAGCRSLERPAHMNQHDVVEFVRDAFGDKSESEIVTDFLNAQVLILKNPQWGISLLKLSGADPDSQTTALTSMEYALPLRTRNLIALAALDAPLPVSCLLLDKIYRTGALAAALAVAVFICYGLYRAVAVYRQRRRRRDDQVYSMVARIEEFLSCDDAAGTSVPVAHVRDALIAPQNRAAGSAVWDAAVEYLERNESRVRFETETVDGEEHRSMRWVSPGGSPRGHRGGAHAWQGQAFETQKGSMNNLRFSPTPCLKIRHMIEKNDKNPNAAATIRDAILEKCGPSCRILHVDVDKASCCVFVKCASPEDAGVVYQNLHGWWYEGHLITVKYLRLERYMDHFPFSPSSGPYLKPSGGWESVN